MKRRMAVFFTAAMAVTFMTGCGNKVTEVPAAVDAVKEVQTEAAIETEDEIIVVTETAAFEYENDVVEATEVTTEATAETTEKE